MKTLALASAAGLLLVATVGLLPGDPPRDKEAERLAALVANLGDDDFDTREAAGKALQSLGAKALPALLDGIARGAELETRRRAWLLVRAMTPATLKSKAVGLAMARIEPGAFRMGSPEDERNRRDGEGQHRVHIRRPFYLGAYEVTQDEYRQVMKAEPSWFSARGGGKGKVAGHDTGSFPVEGVSWFDAVEFCNRLSKRDGLAPYYALSDATVKDGSITAATAKVLGGRGYRLPTEAEWEYACRAGTQEAYHFGARTRRGLANMKPIRIAGGYGGDVLQWPDLGRTTGVGSHPPNAWGLYDMHGNVAEWCQDWFGMDYYAASPAADPAGPASGTQRSLRGGSWLVTDASSRSASRAGQAPSQANWQSGFRVARNP